MHNIEPHFLWRDHYVASEDRHSPFYGRNYDEFQYTQAIYNYFIHPQWDGFGSNTLYMKILFADYDLGFAVFEFIGEWNDCINNDVMYLKREVVDQMAPHGINKFILIGENVLNFHGSDDCYYEEWYEDVADEDGWICALNLLDHVSQEMKDMRLHHYINFGEKFDQLDWRKLNPKVLFLLVDAIVNGREVMRLS